MLGCRRYNRRLRFGLLLRQCHGVHGLLVFAFGLLLGMLGQRIREQITGYGRLIVFRHWLRDIQRAKFKLVDLASNIIRAEDGGRSPARKSRISSTDISAASGSCGAS